MNYQFQYLYPSNVQFLRKDILEPVHEVEIRNFLAHKLRKLRFHELLLHNTYFIIVIQGIFTVTVVSGDLLLLMFGFYSGFISLVNQSFKYLVLAIVLLSIGLISLYYYVRPLVLSGYWIVSYLFAHTSVDRLYVYLVKLGSISEGVIKDVEMKDGTQIITYSFSPKNGSRTRREEYITSSQVKVEPGNSVYVLHISKVSVIL